MGASQDVEYVSVGPKPYLDRLLIEYGLTEAEVGDKIRSQTASFWIDGEVFELEYLVHESVLRSLGEFSCAGDAEALSFCGEMADAMVSSFGVARDEAVAHINRRWSHSGPRGRSSRVWVVGLDIVYHETPEYWAAHHYTQDGSP
jgi:hypothetical protein